MREQLALRVHNAIARLRTARSAAPRTEEAVMAVEPKGVDATSVEESDRRFVFHPFTQLDKHERIGSPSVIVEGNGSRLTHIHGRSYTDAMAGLVGVSTSATAVVRSPRRCASTPSGSATTTRSPR